ncbi:MAG: hypothetical protein AAFR13_09980 [Pseudomonadota bacterium]
MGQILIRNVDDDVHARLKAKAAEKGQSLEAYVRALLNETTKVKKAEALQRAAEQRARQRKPLHNPPDDLIGKGRDERSARLWDVLNNPNHDR